MNAASRMQGDLQRAFGTARDLQSTLTGLQATGATRPQADRVQRSLLERHEDYLGVWSGWEPDAFDRDAGHRGEAGTDRHRPLPVLLVPRRRGDRAWPP